MAGKRWTDDQKKVIFLRDRNILVSAAAGSGKTTVLVERIIELITDKSRRVDIDRLLVVTFTKAAAAQMRSGVGRAIEKKLLEEPEDEHLQRQATLLHNAQITTIDSFCQNIIRNYFHIINLDPELRIADENELVLQKTEILQDLLEECYSVAREKQDFLFLQFTELFAMGRTDSSLEDLVLQLHEVSNSYPWPQEWLRECGELYNAETLEELEESDWMKKLMLHIRGLLADYERMAQRALFLCREADGPSQYESAIASDLKQIALCCEADSYSGFYEAFRSVNPARLSSKRNADASVEKKELVKSLRESYMKNGILSVREQFFYQEPEEMFTDIQNMAPFVGELVRITLLFSERYQAQKLEQGVMDFADLEHFALDILLEHDSTGTRPSVVAKELQEFYEEIMTDEYQDSNYVQELLLGSLSRAPQSRPYLFMVGDVKQSIYQFRLARPELFMEKYDTYSLEDSKMQRIDLHQNFRSRKLVLQASNYLFERIMKRELGGICYDEAASLVPGREFAETEQRSSGRTKVLLIEQKSEDVDEVLEKKMLEAAAIAAQIRDMVHGEKPLYLCGEDGYRPVQYRDIVILLRSLSGWSEVFVETLADLKIPAYADSKTGYFSAIEVETVLNLLRVIDNPRQDIPLAAVLRSQFVGLTDEELARLGVLSDGLNFWDAVRVLVGEDDESAQAWKDLQMDDHANRQLYGKLKQFTKLLERYRNMALDCSVYELLRDIFHQTGFYDIMSAMPAGEKRSANLDILLQKSLEFADNGHRGIFGFTYYIENLKKSNIDFGEADVDGEHTNAVRIMSIHKSKGLQFPVVFVAGLGKQFNLQDARKSTIINADYGIGADYVNLDLRYRQPTLLKKFMANQIKQNTLAEEIRILYVALTRAEEQLILSGSAAKLSQKWEKWRQRSMAIDTTMLLTSQTYLDWIMPALFDGSMTVGLEECEDGEPILCGGGLFEVEMARQQDIVTQEKQDMLHGMELYQNLSAWPLDVVYDEEMAQALRRLEEDRYAFEGDLELPVKISVSDLKRAQIQLRADSLAEVMEETQQLFSGESAAEEKDSDGQTDGERLPEFMKEKRPISGAALGSLYHVAMEHFPYEQIQSGVSFDVRGYLTELAEQGYFTQNDCVRLQIGRFRKFMESNLGRRMAAAAQRGSLRREQPFMLSLSAREISMEGDEPILVQGIIDAYFEEEGRLVLVDYKTDRVGADGAQELKEKYSSQLGYYAQALQRLTGKEVSERIIYSFFLGQEIPV